MIMESSLNNTDNPSPLDGHALQERLTIYAHSTNSDVENRTGVWGEHSYARARGSLAHSHVRTLLTPRASSPPPGPDDDVDVTSAPSEPPELPCDAVGDDPDEEDVEEENWEDRLRALAPNTAHVRLADEAVEILRALRLERLSNAGSATGAGRWARREGVRAAARRLRRALAAHWGGGAAWLHGALGAQLPRPLRTLYRELLPELRRTIPRLVARLPLARPVDLVRDPFSAVPEPKSADEPGPWLAWAPSGCDANDRRWTRRLGALLHTRMLNPPTGPAASASPLRWCAAVAEGARAALKELRTEAAGRTLVLGGVGAGAALASWLAGGTRVRGLLLLGPPLLTAEGTRDAEAPPTPLLAIVGGAAAAGGRVLGGELTERGGRLLVLEGADDALRLPRRHRRRLHLPQEALDAAVAEECARWILELAETPESTSLERAERPRRKGATSDDEKSATGASNRPVEIVEGRVVRVSGSTPLTLRPRRSPLAPADILQMPIVFVDDALPTTTSPAPPPPLTPTAVAPPVSRRGRRGGGSGDAVRYARVVVAKRGRPAGPALLRRRALS